MTAINSAQAMLLLLTRHSTDSGPVKREVERALNRRVPVIPVRLEPVPPSPALEYMISTSQWVDAFPPPLERHLEAVVAGVKKALGIAHATPRPDRNAGADHFGRPYFVMEYVPGIPTAATTPSRRPARAATGSTNATARPALPDQRTRSCAPRNGSRPSACAL
jgi:hypothetical protein